MLDFIVTAYPRSGTAWVSNFLSTGDVFCLHDPCNTHHYQDWAALASKLKREHGYAKVGVCCTMIWRWPEWLDEQSCPIMVLRHEKDRRAVSAKRRRLPIRTRDDTEGLTQLAGETVWFEDLFVTDCARSMWERLVGEGFDPVRHSQLTQMLVEKDLTVVETERRVVQRLTRELGNRSQPGARKVQRPT